MNFTGENILKEYEKFDFQSDINHKITPNIYIPSEILLDVSISKYEDIARIQNMQMN